MLLDDAGHSGKMELIGKYESKALFEYAVIRRCSSKQSFVGIALIGHVYQGGTVSYGKVRIGDQSISRLFRN